MGQFQDLKAQAAIIRDEQNSYQNTSLRVGRMFIDILEQLEKVLPDENVKPETLTVEATETSYKLKFSTLTSDGSVKSHELDLPIATDTKAGVMSPELMKGIKDQISQLSLKVDSNKTDSDNKITELKSETILSSNNLILYQGGLELAGNLKDKEPNIETKNRCYAPLFKTQDVVLEVPDGFEIRLIYGDIEYNAVGSIIYGAKEINTEYPYGLLVVAKSDNGDFSPSDVSIVIKNKDLSKDIDTVNKDIKDTKEDVIAKHYLSNSFLKLYQGQIYLGGNIFDNTPVESSKRLYTKVFETKKVNLTFEDDYAVSVIYADENGDSVGGAQYDVKEINDEYPYAVASVRRRDDGDLTISDVQIRITEKDIDSINQSIDSINKNVDSINQSLDSDGSDVVEIVWEDGGIVTTDGTTGPTSNRRRTNDYIDISTVSVIEFTETVSSCFMIMFYDQDKSFISTYIGTYSFASTDIDTPLDINNIAPLNAAYFKMVIKSDIVSDDVFVLKSNLGIKYSISAINRTLAEINGKIKNVYSFDNVIVVDANGKGNYTKIEDALKYANDSDDNHVLIYVMPGIYYPAPKINDAPYNESKRNISIIGVDKNSCILKGNVGYYYWQQNVDYALLRLNGNVTIANLTFDNRSDLYEQTATENGWDLSSQHCRAYCIHVDGERQEDSVIEIRNCHLYNDHFTCIGFGTRPDSTLKIVDCECISDVSEEKNEQSGFSSYGTLYGHLYSNSTQPNQNLEIVRCQIINTNYETAINLMDAAGDGASSNVKLIQNACSTSNMMNAFKKVDKFSIDKLSSGNNVSEMNYNN